MDQLIYYLLIAKPKRLMSNSKLLVIVVNYVCRDILFHVYWLGLATVVGWKMVNLSAIIKDDEDDSDSKIIQGHVRLLFMDDSRQALFIFNIFAAARSQLPIRTTPLWLCVLCIRCST